MKEEEELLGLLKDCFVEVTDEFNITFSASIGVAVKFKNGNVGSVLPTMEELKMKFPHAKRYCPTIQIFIEFNEFLGNKRTRAKNVIRFESAFEKFLLLTEDYTLMKNTTNPYFEFKDVRYGYNLVFKFVKYDEEYEYLPLIIQSKRVQ